MANREYPETPMVGVGGVVIVEGRVLLARRATDPARGEWSIPGGLLESGETLAEGVARELLEETGLTVRPVDLIEVVERIFHDSAPKTGETNAGVKLRPRYHFVILDYLCEHVAGELRPNDEVSELALVSEDKLDLYDLNPLTVRVLRKAFALARSARIT